MAILQEEGREPLASNDPSLNNAKRSYLGGLVMSPAEIQAFVGALAVREARIVQYALLGELRMRQLVQVCGQVEVFRQATSNLTDGSIKGWRLALMKQAVREGDKIGLRELYRSMLAAARRDELGITATRLTACRALEIIVLFTRFDFIIGREIGAAVRELLAAMDGRPRPSLAQAVMGVLELMNACRPPNGADKGNQP